MLPFQHCVSLIIIICINVIPVEWYYSLCMQLFCCCVPAIIILCVMLFGSDISFDSFWSFCTHTNGVFFYIFDFGTSHRIWLCVGSTSHVTPTCRLAVLLRKKLILLGLAVTVMAEIEGEGYKRESLWSTVNRWKSRWTFQTGQLWVAVNIIIINEDVIVRGKILNN